MIRTATRAELRIILNSSPTNIEFALVTDSNEGRSGTDEFIDAPEGILPDPLTTFSPQFRSNAWERSPDTAEQNCNAAEQIAEINLEDATRFVHGTIRHYAECIYRSAISVEREVIPPLREALAAFTEAAGAAQSEAWESLCNLLENKHIIEQLQQAHDSMRTETEVPEKALHLFGNRPDINRDEQPFQLALEFMHNFRNRFFSLIGRLDLFAKMLGNTWKVPYEKRAEHIAHISKQLHKGRKAHGKTMLALHRYFILSRIELIERQVVTRIKQVWNPLIEAAERHDEIAVLELWNKINKRMILRRARLLREHTYLLIVSKKNSEIYYDHLAALGESTNFIAEQTDLLFGKTETAAKALSDIANALPMHITQSLSSDELNELAAALDAWDEAMDMGRSFKEWETLGVDAEVSVFHQGELTEQ